MSARLPTSRLVVATSLAILGGCSGGSPPPGGSGGDAGYAWDLPVGFPLPAVPADNPMSAEKVALGRHLFHDKRLSGNEQQSCADCHKQELAFTDGRVTPLGSTGQAHPRNAMSLANVGYASTLTWANPLQRDLEHQALVPMFGDDPVELGLTEQAQIEERLRGIALYGPLFRDAFPGDAQPITLTHVVQALASFERTLVSGRSPFDRYQYGGDPTAISDAAKRGYTLFNSETMECFHCHVGFNLTDHVDWADKAFFDQPYHNTGLYNLGADGDYPEPNTGVHHVTHRPADMGRFKAPTLRNIAVTAPYMHDGSVATLEEALDHYQAGGRTITGGPNAGNGSLNPHKDPILRAFELTPAERADVLEFLKSLTDEEFLHAPELSSPF